MFTLPSSTWQLVGSLSIIGVGLICLLVAFTWDRFCVYGRETLFGCSGFVIYIAVIRLAYSPLGWLDQHDARNLTGLGGLAFLIAMSQLLVLHYLWHLHQRVGVKRQ